MPSPPLPRSSRALRWAVPAAAFLVALAVRIVYLRQLADTPYADALVVDEELYDERARAIAAGDWRLGTRPYYQDPLYSYLLGGLYLLLGRDLALVRQVQAVVGALGAAAVAALGQRVGGPWVGGTAALLAATLAPVVFYDAQIEKTGPTVALSALALLAWERAATPRGRGRVVAGACVGALALLRGNFLALVPFALVAAYVASGRSRRAATAVGLGIGIAILPATARNLAVSGELVLVTSQGGQNFYLGNRTGNDTGSYVALPFVRPHPRHEEADFELAAERSAGRELSAVEVSRFWWRRGLEDVLADPVRFFRLTLLRITLAVHPTDAPDNYDQRFMARFVPLLRGPLPPAGIVLALGLAGLALAAWRREHAARLLAGYVVLYVLSLAPFFVFGRYRAPILPALAVGAGFLVREAVRALARRKWRGLLAPLGSTAVLGAALASLPEIPAIDGQNWNTLGTVYEKAGDPVRAGDAYARAQDVDPENPLPVYNQARLLEKAGRLEEAAAAFRRSLRLPPERAEAQVNLAACLTRLGRPEEAETALRRALQLDPNLADAVFQLAAIAEARGERLRAAALYRAAAEKAGETSRLGREARLRAIRLEQGP